MKVVQSHNSKESFKGSWMQTVNWRTTNIYFIEICPFLLGRRNNYRKVLIQLKSKYYTVNEQGSFVVGT